MRKILGILFLAGTLFAPLLEAAVAAPSGNCPVMPKEKFKSKFFVDYQGERHFLCCRGCVRKFKKNPEKYLGKK